MSFTSPAFGEYGNTHKGADYALFWGKNHAVISFSGHGTTDFYLKRPSGSQAIYVPPETFGAIVGVKGWMLDTAASTAHPLQLASVNTYVMFENDGGAIEPASNVLGTYATDVTLTLVENETINGFEVLLAEGTGSRDMYCQIDIELAWVNDTYKSLVSSTQFPTGATAALTSDE